MKIEFGKKYVLHNGYKIEIVGRSGTYFVGRFFDTEEEVQNCELWAADGVHERCYSDYKIVSEYGEPEPKEEEPSPLEKSVAKMFAVQSASQASQIADIIIAAASDLAFNMIQSARTLASEIIANSQTMGLREVSTSENFRKKDIDVERTNAYTSGEKEKDVPRDDS